MDPAQDSCSIECQEYKYLYDTAHGAPLEKLGRCSDGPIAWDGNVTTARLSESALTHAMITSVMHGSGTAHAAAHNVTYATPSTNEEPSISRMSDDSSEIDKVFAQIVGNGQDRLDAQLLEARLSALGLGVESSRQNAARLIGAMAPDGATTVDCASFRRGFDDYLAVMMSIHDDDDDDDDDDDSGGGGGGSGDDDNDSSNDNEDADSSDDGNSEDDGPADDTSSGKSGLKTSVLAPLCSTRPSDLRRDSNSSFALVALPADCLRAVTQRLPLHEALALGVACAGLRHALEEGGAIWARALRQRRWRGRLARAAVHQSAQGKMQWQLEVAARALGLAKPPPWRSWKEIYIGLARYERPVLVDIEYGTVALCLTPPTPRLGGSTGVPPPPSVVRYPTMEGEATLRRHGAILVPEAAAAAVEAALERNLELELGLGPPLCLVLWPTDTLRSVLALVAALARRGAESLALCDGAAAVVGEGDGLLLWVCDPIRLQAGQAQLPSSEQD
eukprot:SAG11_NODE_961_length_6379_cov_141.081529_3_plen_504_part_00